MDPYQCSEIGSYTFQPNSALVQISTEVGAKLLVVRDNCGDCLWVTACHFMQKDMQLLFNTTSASRFQILLGDANHTPVVDMRYQFGHMGVYELQSANKVAIIVPPETMTKSVLAIIAFLVLILIFDSLVMGWQCLQKCRINRYRRFHEIDESLENEIFDDRNSKRIKSIDIIRGSNRMLAIIMGRFTICLMIFVNYGGGGMWFFNHSSWNGFTIADFVFPNFIFLVGLSYGITTIKKHIIHSVNHAIVRRTVVLFIIGVFIINRTSVWSGLRIMGVLQRIAGATIIFHCIRWIIYRYSAFRFVEVIMIINVNSFIIIISPTNYIQGDSIPRHYSSYLWKESTIVYSICTLISFAFLLFKEEDCPRGYFGPGGISHQGDYSKCTGGLNRYVDKTFLTESHMYNRPTCRDPYYCTERFEPEGIIGTMMAVFNVYAGFQVAVIYLYSKTVLKRVQYLVMISLVYGSLAITLDYTVIPINKNLWTLSYCLLTSAISVVCFLSVHCCVDIAQLNILRLFQYCGQNALLAYILQSLGQFWVPINWTVSPSYLSMTLMGLWGITAHIIFCSTLAWQEIRVSL